MATCVIHGNSSDLPSSRRHSPTMKFSFSPTITRSKSDPRKVKVKFSWKFWIGKDAYYGYKLRVGVKVNGTWYTVKTKSASDSEDWEFSGTKTNIPEFVNMTTSTSITVGAYAKDKKGCYTGSGYSWSSLYPIKTYTFKTPPPNYFITYNLNGGTGGPDPNPQECAAGKNAILSAKTPNYPLIVNYYYGDTPGPVDVLPLNQQGQPIGTRPFINWRGSDGNAYSPSATYTGKANCTMTAQWSNITFNPRSMNNEHITITYHCNGGYIEGSHTATTPWYFAKYGYGINPTGSDVTYVPGTSYTITPSTATLNLYPRYSSTVTVTSLAVPTRRGYSFDGWYYDNGTWEQRATVPMTLDHDIDLYAKWIPVPVHKFDNGTWKDSSQYVWRYNGTAWEKVAHIYRYENGTWIDISES